jgi:hypothetical protein
MTKTVRNFRLKLFPVALAIGTCAWAQGQTLPAQPTSNRAPTTSVSTTKVTVDISTPRAAIKTFARALQRGDGDALRAVMYAANPAEQHMVDAMISMTGAYASFRQAAEAQFGAKEFNDAMGDLDAQSKAALARIDSAVESIDGDKATLKVGDEPAAILYRRNGKWQVVTGSLSPSDSAKAVEDRALDLERQAVAVNEITEEIRTSKYRSMREVLTVLHGQMMKAAVESPESESGPTTAP